MQRLSRVRVAGGWAVRVIGNPDAADIELNGKHQLSRSGDEAAITDPDGTVQSPTRGLPTSG